jgi:hypothetical protein
LVERALADHVLVAVIQATELAEHHDEDRCESCRDGRVEVADLNGRSERDGRRGEVGHGERTAEESVPP